MNNGFSPGGSVSATQLDSYNYPIAHSALLSISRKYQMKARTLSVVFLRNIGYLELAQSCTAGIMAPNYHLSYT